MTGNVGRWQLVAPLGRGGMGVVYRARDEAGHEGALKLVAAGTAASPDALARFDREVRAARGISHANVLPVLDAGVQAGVPFLVTELACGGSLDGRGALPWREAVRLATGIARGLVAIHAAGLVHRDLKPANVLLDEAGTPKVADLGLVRRTDGTHSRDLTKTGDVLGTPGFAAPEQLEAAKHVDARADLYALGATLHALVAGEPPFPGDGYEVLRRVLLDAPPRLRALVPDVPAALEELVLGLLAKDPDDRRPSTAALVVAALEELAAGTVRRGRARLAVALVATAVLASGGAWATTSLLRARAADRARREREQLVASAEAHLGARRFREAAGDAARLLERDPDDVRALEVRGLARFELDERPAARADLDRACRLDPLSARAHAGAARCAHRAGDLLRARELSTRAIGLDGKVALGHLARAEALASFGDVPGARAAATRAIELAPGALAPWVARAQVRRLENDFTGALEDLARASAITPDDPVVVSTRAHCLVGVGDKDAALADAERVVALAPALAPAWTTRAFVRGQRGDSAGAIADCDRALALDPASASAWFYRAEAHVRLDDRAAAVEDLRRGVAHVPTDRRLRQRLLIGLIELGNLDEILVAAEESIAREPTLAEGHYARAFVRERRDDIAGARADLEKVIELAPESPFAAQATKDLEKLAKQRRRGAR